MISLVSKCLLLLLLASLPMGHAGALTFVHPPPESPGDERHRYYWELLESALDANRDTYGDYRMQPSAQPITFARAVAELESGAGVVNIVSRATSRDLERRLRPIRIPLDKGLLGVRLFLAMPATQARLNQVSTLSELRRFSIGQNATWTDVRVLAAAGFPIVLSDGYATMFDMLGAGRFDLFSRGAIEIAAEMKSFGPAVPGMAIDPRFLLQYPMPRYFFVPRTPAGALMAERIEDGLRRLRASGEFERRYQAYKRLALKDLNLVGRIVIRLPNPELSTKAPLNDPYWWDDLAAELKPSRGP
jgi:hypothetical protein